MSFLSPWWLLALLPWAGVVLWLLWGRRRRTDVPFLELWKGPVEPPKDRRALQAPPLWLATAMVAMLLAVLAASRPALRWVAHQQGPHLSIIVDRGATMSARGTTEPRYRELADTARDAIASAMGDGPVDFEIVPGASHVTDRSHWAQLASASPPTAMDTSAEIRGAIARRLAAENGPVIVLTDHPLDIHDRRLVQIAPSTAPANVAIVAFSIRENPAPQAMVRLRNDSRLNRVMLRIMSDSQPIAQAPVDLPPNGQEQNYFLDVTSSSLGRVISAEIDAKDDLAADNRRFLVRQQLWPALEAGTPLPPELRRMMDVYARRYQAGNGGKHVSIVNSADALPVNVPAAAVVLQTASSTTRPSAAQIQVVDHPITRHIDDWSALLSSGAAQPPADGGWTRLVWSGDRVLLAVRGTPVRQVWTVHNEDWARTPYQFVAFWTNVFNWLGEGGESFASSPVAQLGSEWKPLVPQQTEPGLWPGTYQREQSLVAVNAPEIRIPAPIATSWYRELSRLADEYAPQARGWPLAPALLLAAIAAAVLSAATWKAKRTTIIRPSAAPEHVD